MIKPNIEILAPCGSYDILKAAIKAGTDACYIGGSRFGARAYADNFSDAQLEEAIDYIHIHGKKLYLTVNTLIKESELSDVFSYIKNCYEAGIDAFIVQDFGVFKLIRDNFPDAVIHCSTQMNITSYHAAKLMKEYGAARVVTAREMTLNEIKLIKDKVDIEVETFVHGAMCYSYSGECLLSSLAGGRSGNRGRCAQPCRKCYDGEYILSMKDMCSLEHIPKLVEAKIDSFKIEGRMKNEYYVASAVDAYKELTEDYINGCFSVEKALKMKKRLANVYNRGGFCDGYFFLHNSGEMISKKRPNNQGVKIGSLKNVKDGMLMIKLSEDIYKGDILEVLLTDKEIIEITSGKNGKKGENIWLNSPKTKRVLKEQDIYRTRCNYLLLNINKMPDRSKIKIRGEFRANKGQPISLLLSLTYNETDFSVMVEKDIVEKSNNIKCDKEMIFDKLNQLGDTDYIFESLDIYADDDAFIAASVLKKLRREAISLLEYKIKKYYKKNCNDKNDFMKEKMSISALPDEKPKLKISVKTKYQLEAVLNYSGIYGIYMDYNLFNEIKETDIMQIIKDKAVKIYLELPYVVCKDTDLSGYVSDNAVSGIFVRNIDELSIVKNYNKEIVCGFFVYAYNNIARSFLYSLNDKIIFELPKELNINELKQLNQLPSELCIYEYQQVMISNNCIKKSKNKCNKTVEAVRIKDDMKNSFYAYSVCDECINVLYNGIPFLCFDKKNIMDLKGVIYHRINFTIEDKTMTEDILKYYFNGIKPDMTFTSGHLLRGVE